MESIHLTMIRLPGCDSIKSINRLEAFAGWLVAAFLVSASSLVIAAMPYPPEIPEAQVEVYKVADGFDLRVWILNPPDHRADKPVPAAVFFFGGGWTGGSPIQFLKHAEYLNARGMVAVLADYRVKSRQGVKAESCVSDAKSVVRWMRSNAVRLGIDSDRILVAGGSAGGHLAAATAFVPGQDDPGDDLSVSCRPDALALFNPVLLLAPIPEIGEGSLDRVQVFASRTDLPPTDLSPYHHLEAGAPPCIIFHGTADTTFPFPLVQAFREKSVALGNRCELVSYEGDPHGFFNYGRKRSAYFFDTMYRLDAFLVSLGYLEGLPVITHLK